MVKRTRIPAHSTNYYVGRRDAIKYIVIHTGETGEGSTPAEGMGNWFAVEHPAGQRSSAHQGADTDSICTYVDDPNTAFGAPGVNAAGWHLEHAGRAGQTSGQWDDAASRLILANGALAAAEASKRLDVPARWLTDAELRAGNMKGFITHAQASRVLGGTHWDPGPAFPADHYMALVRSHLSGTPTSEEDEVTPDDIKAIAKAVADEAWTRPVDDGQGGRPTTGAAIGFILRNSIAALNEDRAGRAALLAAVKAGQDAGPQADAAAIVDALAARLATKETP